MKGKEKPRRDLLREIAELQTRLAEAEDVCRAIRHDEVDAVVVQGPQTERVYTLQGAEHPYRMLVEAMSEGAVTLIAGSTILYCNQAFAVLIKTPLEQVIGSQLDRFIAPADRALFEALVRHGESESRKGEVTLIARDGTALPTQLSLSPLPVGEGGGLCLVVTDLSGQKRHEEIVAAERLARSILEQAAQAIVVCDAEGRVIRANRKAQELCGRNPVLRPFEAAFPLQLVSDGLSHVPAGDQQPDGAGEAFSLSGVTGGRADWRGEVTFTRPDGQVFSLLLNAGPLHGSDERPLGNVVALTDITERRQAEVAAAQMAAIVESSDDAIISKDLNGIIASWNRGAEKLFGYTAAEIIGKPVAILIPPDRVNEEPQILERLRRGERINHFETVRRHKGGSGIDISLTVSPVRDRTGKVIGASKIARDITERKRLSKQVELERSRLKYLFDRAPAFVTVLRGPEHVFELFNPAYLQLVGHRELIGKTMREAFPEVEGQGFFELLDGVYRTGEPYAGREMRIFLQRMPDAPLEERFVNFVCQAMFEADGSVSGVFAHGVDVTEQVLARKAVEEANRLKDEFLATLSHELRNPLNSIIGHAEVLARKPDNGAVRQAAESIRRNALSQAELIGDLLDLSRLQTGKLALDRQPIDLASVIGDAVDSLRPQAKAKKIRLGIYVTRGPLMTEADPVRVQQVVWNLLANAIKFTPDSGKITVNLSREGREAKLAVGDTGQGIDPGFLKHIFEMFRQGDAGTTRRHGGMGIGLALVRQLVELHGGRVEARSEGVGRGACFSVWLPLDAAAPEAATRPAAREAASQGLAGLRLLVVDDTPDAVAALQDMLELEGALVTTATSGAEALEIAGAARFDLILSDVSMPEMDGYQFLEELRKGGRSAGVPAIALTGLGRPEDVERARAVGFTTHLTKPVTLDKLTKVVRAAARQGVRPKISTSVNSSKG